MNLLEGITQEIKRCQELVKQYELIGPPGKFAAMQITQDIARAERARDSGSLVDQIQALEALKGSC